MKIKINKGIFIPQEILMIQELNSNDKIILSEIYADNSDDNSCSKTNHYFAKLIGIDDRNIRVIISKLAKLNLIKITNANSCKRKIFINFGVKKTEDSEVRFTNLG